jgi:hypothetical protein
MPVYTIPGEELRGTMMCSLRITMLLAIAILTGCSSSVTLVVKDKDSEKPLEGILVERACPVSSIGKIFHPIGATYHPLRVAESNRTDKAGEVTFKKSNDRVVYRIYRDDARSLVVSVLGKEIALDPPATNRVAGTKWGYAIWAEDGALKQSAWPVKE